jgi:hypothetical protein
MYIREVMIIKKERESAMRKEDGKRAKKEVEQQQKMCLKQTSREQREHNKPSSIYLFLSRYIPMMCYCLIMTLNGGLS